MPIEPKLTFPLALQLHKLFCCSFKCWWQALEPRCESLRCWNAFQRFTRAMDELRSVFEAISLSLMRELHCLQNSHLPATGEHKHIGAAE